jgi:hypothetical protein
MKTRIYITVLMVFALFPVNKSLDACAQDDIYYTPSQNKAPEQVYSNYGNQETAETKGMTDYEKYRSLRDAGVSKDDIYSKPDSTVSQEELARKKGMERYGQRNTDTMENTNQSYSLQYSDTTAQQGNTIINNYFDDNDNDYGDRYDWYHRFYFDYYWDPFVFGFYDPFYWGWGISWGWPYWGFRVGWYGPGYWYDPFYYGYSWGGCYNDGYWYGHHNGYYDRSYYGEARRSMGGYRDPSDVRRSSLYRGQTYASTGNRRSSTTSGISQVDRNGRTYSNARRDAYPLYQKTTSGTGSNVSSGRREVSKTNVYDRYKNVQTTRYVSNYRRENVTNNTKSYSPSYSTQRTNSRTQYNSGSSGNNYNYRRNTGSGTKSSGNTSYSNPTYNAPRRSTGSVSSTYSNPGYSKPTSSGHTYTPSRSSSSSSSGSWSSGSSSSGSHRSSGSGFSSSGSSHSSSGSGHSGSSGSSGGRRR